MCVRQHCSKDWPRTWCPGADFSISSGSFSIPQSQERLLKVWGEALSTCLEGCVFAEKLPKYFSRIWLKCWPLFMPTHLCRISQVGWWWQFAGNLDLAPGKKGWGVPFIWLKWNTLTWLTVIAVYSWVFVRRLSDFQECYSLRCSFPECRSWTLRPGVMLCCSRILWCSTPGVEK